MAFRRRATAARFLLRSLSLRGATFLLALLAVTVGAAMTATMLGIKSDLGAKMSRELRRYGPNLLVAPAAPPGKDPGSLDPRAVARAAGGGGPSGASPPIVLCPMLLVTGTVRAERAPSGASGDADAAPPGESLFTRGAAATLVGADLESLREIYPSWRVEGAWPQPGEEAALMGSSLAKRARITPGSLVLLRVPILGRNQAPAPAPHGAQGRPAHAALPSAPIAEARGMAPGEESGGRRAPMPAPRHAADSAEPLPGAAPKFREVRLRVAGLLTTGEAADEEAFLALPALRQGSGSGDASLSLIALSVDGGAEAVDRAAERITRETGASARPLRAIASAQGAILGKLDRMMVLLTLAVLALSGLCLVTTLMASVVERESEIGLMRSIGAGDVEIVTMFLGEVSLVGLAGGVAGLAIGAVGARIAGARLFGAAIELRAGVVPIVLGLSLALAIVSVLIPLRRALAVQPAAALRGD